MDVACPHCTSSQSLSSLESTLDLTCDTCGGTLNGNAAETEVATILPIAGKQETMTAVATILPDEDTTPTPGFRPQVFSPDAKPVRMLGHFRLDQKLGEGACGAVYRAFDTKLDRSVAIKIPHGGVVDEVETEQFVREARAAAQLKHPHIVSVHEVSRLGSQIYIVSDYIEGKPLDEHLNGVGFPERDAIELFLKIVDALGHAHEKGIVHRDLKPANILMDRSLEPYVADFGLAKRESEEQTIHKEGSILGTPAYMAPEQARGQSHAVDCRADIYSLGVILFELLTGKRPFRDMSLQALLVKIVSEPAPSPRTLRKSISKDLETICLRCLEKEPEKRFASAGDLAEELRRFLRGEPIQSRPVGFVEQSYRWCHRNPTAATLFAAVVVTGVLGGVVSGTFSYLTKKRMQAQADQQRREMDRREAELAVQKAEAAKLRAQQESTGWTAAQIRPEDYNHLNEELAVDAALNEFQKRTERKRSGRTNYNVNELTKAVLNQTGRGNSAERMKMLNKLEGDLNFLNNTLGGK